MLDSSQGHTSSALLGGFPKTSNLNTGIAALLCISLCVLAPDKNSIIFSESVSPGDTTASPERGFCRVHP